MSITTQRYFWASTALVGLVVLAGTYAIAWPFYLVFVVAAGLFHAIAASLAPDAIRPRHLASETVLVVLAVGAVLAYVLRLVPSVEGLWSPLGRILAAALTSKAGVASLLAYVGAWGLLIGALSFALALLSRAPRRSLASRWQLTALALAATSVIFRYALYDPVREVGVWRPQGKEALVASMAVAALLEPVVLYGVVLAIVAVLLGRTRMIGKTFGRSGPLTTSVGEKR